jgi:hypothetical protein
MFIDMFLGAIMIMIYNYLCSQCLSRFKFSVRIPLMAIQHYVIKFVSDLQQVDGFLFLETPASSTNKKLTATMYLKYC